MKDKIKKLRNIYLSKYIYYKRLFSKYPTSYEIKGYYYAINDIHLYLSNVINSNFDKDVIRCIIRKYEQSCNFDYMKVKNLSYCTTQKYKNNLMYYTSKYKIDVDFLNKFKDIFNEKKENE